MVRYFVNMKKEVAVFAASTAGTEAMQEAAEQQQLKAAVPVEAIHTEYKDGDPKAKEVKLEEIEAEVKGFLGFLDICTEIDFYQMAADFGKMIVNNKRCVLKGKNSEGGEATEMLNSDIWESKIHFKDRLNATIRYCCFFGLTSSSLD